MTPIFTQGRRAKDRIDTRPFCKPVEIPEDGARMRVCPSAIPALLSLPKYKGVDAMDLIEMANTRLRIPAYKKLVAEVTDRATAIAVLEGIR